MPPKMKYQSRKVHRGTQNRLEPYFARLFICQFCPPNKYCIFATFLSKKNRFRTIPKYFIMYLLLRFQRNSKSSTSSTTSVQSSDGRQEHVHIIKYNKNQFSIIKIVFNNSMEIMFK